MQQYVKEQGDNVNRAEIGAVALDGDQGDVPTVGEEQDTEKESDHPEHPSHTAPMDRVCRTRLAKSCGSRDDSLSWNLSRVKHGGAIRTTTWIHGGEGVRWRGGRRVADRTMHKSIETGQKKASAQSAQSARSDEPMH